MIIPSTPAHVSPDLPPGIVEAGSTQGAGVNLLDWYCCTADYGKHDPTCKNFVPHQSQLPPAENKFHAGNGADGKHYWLVPPEIWTPLNAEFNFDFDPCPYPKPDDFDGLTCDWGQRNWVNPPFGSIIHEGKKKGPTAWMRKAITEQARGKLSVVVYPIDKWVLMMVKAIFGANVGIRNLGDVRWLATEDRSQGKGTGRHIAAFILEARP